jgi:hypothetical protein
MMKLYKIIKSHHPRIKRFTGVDIKEHPDLRTGHDCGLVLSSRGGSDELQCDYMVYVRIVNMNAKEAVVIPAR